jgi:hypothetical protein
MKFEWELAPPPYTRYQFSPDIGAKRHELKATEKII